MIYCPQCLPFLTSTPVRGSCFPLFCLYCYNLVGCQAVSELDHIFFFPQESTKLKVEDVQLSMDDLEMIQVIGKGSGGVVQLVRHKWVGTLYALKVIPVVQIYLVVTQLMHRLDVEYAPSRCRLLNLFCFSIIVFLGLKSNPFFFKWHMVCVFSDNQNFLCLIMWFLCLILSAMAWPHSFHFTPYILVNEVEMPNE